MIPEIQAWINGDKDYAKGIILYQRHGVLVEPQKVVAAETQIFLKGQHQKKLYDKLMEIYKKSNTNAAVSANALFPQLKKTEKEISLQNSSTTGSGTPYHSLPSNDTDAKMPTKQAHHKDNGTVNVLLGDASIMKIHLRLVEKVNGVELMMGQAGAHAMSFGQFLKMLYSGVKLDLVVCTLNVQQKKGGERHDLRGVISTVHREWSDVIVDDTNKYDGKQQKLLIDLRKVWIPWWAELCDNHSKLKVINDTKERLALALRIRELEVQCKKCWDATAWVKQWGCVPEGFIMPKLKVKAIPTDGAAMQKKLNNVEVNISKYRKALRLKLEKEDLLKKKEIKLKAAIEERDLLRSQLGLVQLKDE